MSRALRVAVAVARALGSRPFLALALVVAAGLAYVEWRNHLATRALVAAQWAPARATSESRSWPVVAPPPALCWEALGGPVNVVDAAAMSDEEVRRLARERGLTLVEVVPGGREIEWRTRTVERLRLVRGGEFDWDLPMPYGGSGLCGLDESGDLSCEVGPPKAAPFTERVAAWESWARVGYALSTTLPTFGAGGLAGYAGPRASVGLARNVRRWGKWHLLGEVEAGAAWLGGRAAPSAYIGLRFERRQPRLGLRPAPPGPCPEGPCLAADAPRFRR